MTGVQTCALPISVKVREGNEDKWYYSDAQGNIVDYTHPEPNKKYDITPEGFKQFLNDNPYYQSELRDKNFIQYEQLPVPQQELYNKLYTKAGMTPEESQWYEQYGKGQLDVEDYNNHRHRDNTGKTIQQRG